jgi:disulfide bond formation protein DsbB
MTTSSHQAAFTVTVISTVALVLALLTAWLAQYGFGLQPCELCLQQRWPYYIGIPLALVLALMAKTHFSARVLKYTQAIFLLLLCWSLYLAIRHSGIEWGWWPGPVICTDTNGSPIKTIDLLAQLKNYKFVPCDKPAWKLFGLLSFANLNALLSVFLFALNACVLVEYDPRKLYGSSTVSQ